MKKRILSLILALSMVLSVLPLGAFAEGSNQELVIKRGVPVGTSGNGWSYDNNTQTLTLTSGTFNFSFTYPQTPNAIGAQPVAAVAFKIQLNGEAKITGGTFKNEVSNNYGTILHSTFESKVTNNNLISDCIFQNGCSVTNGGTIENGTFNNTGSVKNNSIISGGTFQNTGSVENWYTISGGTFQSTSSVTNYGTITGNGTFHGTVTNEGTKATIENGTFNGDVANRGTKATIVNGTFNGDVTNEGTIKDGTFAADKNVRNEGTSEESTISGGTFEGSVMNEGTNAIIKNGTFNGNVENTVQGKISGGAFSSTSTVQNYSGTISGGTFEGSVKNWDSGTISGGTFAAGLSKSDGLIFGGVFNGVIEGTTGAGVYHITVDEASPDAKIEKVNDVPAVWDPYVVIESGKTKEVTVTASTKIYSLNYKPLSTNPYHSSQDSNDKNTVTFTMQNEGVKIGCGGLVMASDGYPIGSNNGTANCEGNGWEYSNGTRTLTDGTFNFNSTYPQNPNNGRGAKPVACAVKTQLRVEITGGTFEGEVINNGLGVISGGTFHEKVSNYNGMITGGTFKSSVTSKDYGRIFGGVFNGNANLTGVTGGCSITVASNAKIEKVNGVSADWAPYVVVTSNATPTTK